MKKILNFFIKKEENKKEVNEKEENENNDQYYNKIFICSFLFIFYFNNIML